MLPPSCRSDPNGCFRSLDSGFRCNQLHRRWIERRLMRSTVHPCVDYIGPFLEHVTALLLILRLVVDATRGFSLLVSQALLDPVAVETQFVEQGRSGSAQVVYGK